MNYLHLFKRDKKPRLSLVLQRERAECGLACLTMISQYFGHEIDLQGMKKIFPSSATGMNLAQLIDISQRLDLQTRAVKLPLEQLKNLKLPAILHWDLDHFVVLKKITGKKIIILDPSKGRGVFSMQQISKHFTGIALELSKTSQFKPIIEQQKISLFQVVGRVNGWLMPFFSIFLLSVLLEIFSLVSPFYLQWILDHVLVAADFDLLNLLLIIFLSLALLNPILSAFRMWSIARISAIIHIQWVSNIISHLFKLPLEWFEKRSIGDVISRIQAIDTINSTLSGHLITSLLNGIMSLILLSIMLLYSQIMTGFLLLLMVGYTLFRCIYFRLLRNLQENTINATAIQQSDILESIRGILTVKLTNMHLKRQARYLNLAVDSSNAKLRLLRLDIVFKLFNLLLFGVGRVLLIWYAAQLVLENQLSAGALVAYLAYSDMFTRALIDFIDKFLQLSMLRLYIERLSDITLTAPELLMTPGMTSPSLNDYSLELREISFKYAGSVNWLFNHFSLRVESGEVIALVGASGCGKTTLVKIILGLIQPSEGAVYFGQQDIQRFGMNNYRDYVSSVMQHDHLFSGTIKQNITLFTESPDEEAMMAVAKAVNIHDEIMQMTMNYASLVGDMGDIFSGGQKQRLLLARALYRQPKLLILDEATSHLDLENERRINQTLTELKITRVIIAHRPETIKLANRVIYLNEQ